MGSVTALPRSRALIRSDLEQLPDDGRRYELIDGALIVTPSPSLRHQRMLGQLYLLLTRGCPDDLLVLLAPFDVALDQHTVMQPDLVVARVSDVTERDLPVAPRLAVEVLSPSTRRLDLTLKRSRLEAAGCPSYWVADPDGPSLRMWTMRDGRYDAGVRVAGDERVDVVAPFPLSMRPADVLG